ncbi:kelch motif-containing protein, partial [Kribbella albertanoniae]
LYFRGSAGLELQVPVHLRIGPVEVQGLTLSVGAGSEGIPVGVGTTFKVAFGPLQAVVEDIGVRATFAIRPDGDGNLGPLDVSFGFKPPTGVGLSVDAGVISGGGYLSFDPEKGEYAGALELEFANFLELKAIGLISTKKPDGSDGFSLLIVIATEFGGGGIQLGYGFTLLAVGGLVGLNRGMNLDALAQGVRSGAIESVMFPKDVVANAPRILSDLRTFFPAEDGKFLIGPMAKIGWGTPSIVTVSLGVIIEIPGNIAIVGVLKCLLPTKELPLLVLQVNFAGAIEFDKSRLWFFAELFESRILFMSIEGGIGLLVGWGDDAELVLTVGGFHPAFQPPALPFPVPRRLAIDILNNGVARIRVEGYFAITSNSVQFGAHAELTLGFDDFGIHGHLGFDALFRFSPFAFVIEVAAGVSLKAFGVGLFGIDLHFVLEGPSPFRAHGRGSISLLFFEISADFDITWGEEHNTVLPPIDVLPLLVSEIGKVDGWRTQLPTGGTKPLVTLRQLDPTEDLVLHPMGTLTVQQRAIPLGVRLDRVGQQAPRDGNRFTVEPAPNSGLVQVTATDDQFAMAQYQTMDDATKLSRPAYERQDAGIELTAEQSATEIARSRFVRRSSRYELRILDNKRKPKPRRTEPLATVSAAAKPKSKYYQPDPAVFDRLLAGNSVSTSPLSQQRAKQLQPFDDAVRIPGRRYVVAYARDNSQAFFPGSTATSFRSASAATDALRDRVGKDPRLAGKLHVIPVDEAHGTAPVPERWSSAGTLPVTTTGSPMVALNNGKVLYAGGTTPDGVPTRSGGLFEVDTATWTTPGELTVARDGHTLTTLLNGRALAIGGTGTETSAEIFDPVTNTWSAVPDPLTVGRSGHTATRLKSGLVLIAGGTSTDGRALASAELFDPATRKWTAVPSMSEARTDHQAVLIGEQVLVIGGRRPTGDTQSAPIAFCEIFNPADKTWTVTADLTAPRSGHQATLLADGGVLVTGGDASGVAVARRFDPASQRTAEVYRDGVWKRVKDLPTGRSHHHSIRIASGEVVVIGGSTGPAHDAGFRSVLVYHPAKDTWRSTGPLGTGRTDFAAALLPDGRLLVAGGIERSTVSVSTAELFTP